ncbi:DUF3152 domain-containing protein [Streptomyces sp. NPDC049813]|uniref:DUF3152 domain-containing protein n=1 Tax=Streptomyces sp. NPDC049813 TaxID=3365597 RepID=UPI0037B60D8D
MASTAAASAHPGTGRRRRTPAEAAPDSASGRPHPAAQAPRVRGGHPEQREPGGGWGAPGGSPGPSGAAKRPGPPFVPRQRPRQEYVDAFDKEAFGKDALGQGAYGKDGFGENGSGKDGVGNDGSGKDGFGRRSPKDPYGAVTGRDEAETAVSDVLAVPRADPRADGDTDQASDPLPGGREKRGKGLTYTGIAAAAVTTVLAVVVAGQVTDRGDGSTAEAQAQSAKGTRVHDGSASRSDARATPSKTAQAAPLTYAQQMRKKYPLATDLKGSGKFEAIPGFDKAPGRGEKFRYRIDVEKGLGLDGSLFAEAVQKTLNDNRSWAHDGARTFERISSGEPNFVITLASPGTTATWCAKSGLDTTEDNVSCDSAATERVMINAYRWAQGSKTYDDVLHGAAIYPYRQMLINHEVGHRLGHNHVSCSQDGALAPVMQQQTKFLSLDGITCKPNPWVFPKG